MATDQTSAAACGADFASCSSSQAYTLATEQIAYSLHSHTDTITSLALHPSQSQLVSCGMDSAVHLWNTAPFAPSLNTSNPALPPRLVRSFFGAPSGFENLLRKVSLSLFRARDGKPGSMIACGGADRYVMPHHKRSPPKGNHTDDDCLVSSTLTVWDTTTGEILYKVSSLKQPRGEGRRATHTPVIASGAHRHGRGDGMVTSRAHRGFWRR